MLSRYCDQIDARKGSGVDLDRERRKAVIRKRDKRLVLDMAVWQYGRMAEWHPLLVRTCLTRREKQAQKSASNYEQNV